MCEIRIQQYFITKNKQNKALINVPKIGVE